MRLNILKKSLKYDEIIKQYNGNWKLISRHQYLSPDFIDFYFFKLKPFNIQYFQKLTPYLMFKYGDNLNWQVLSKTHDIPEILIRKYINKINWWYISEYQNMNDQFILQFLPKLKKEKLFLNKHLKGRLILTQI